MFTIGFITAWAVIALFVLIADNRHSGIELFDGWGTNLLTLPVLIVILPLRFIITKIKEIKYV